MCMYICTKAFAWNVSYHSAKTPLYLCTHVDICQSCLKSGRTVSPGFKTENALHGS